MRIATAMNGSTSTVGSHCRHPAVRSTSSGPIMRRIMRTRTMLKFSYSFTLRRLVIELDYMSARLKIRIGPISLFLYLGLRCHRQFFIMYDDWRWPGRTGRMWREDQNTLIIAELMTFLRGLPESIPNDKGETW